MGVCGHWLRKIGGRGCARPKAPRGRQEPYLDMGVTGGGVRGDGNGAVRGRDGGCQVMELHKLE